MYICVQAYKSHFMLQILRQVLASVYNIRGNISLWSFVRDWSVIYEQDFCKKPLPKTQQQTKLRGNKAGWQQLYKYVRTFGEQTSFLALIIGTEGAYTCNHMTDVKKL